LLTLYSYRYTYYYVKSFEKVSKNEGWAEKEYKRLQGLISKGNLAPEKLDDLTSRSNILRKFLGTDDEEEKSEL
jgi:protein disulfide-isomerase A6